MSSLSHHGIKGQRWGVRRFQNPDGTRTSAGKKQEKLRRLKKTTSEDFISIRKTLSDNDLQMLNYDDESIKYMRENGSLDRDPITDITAHRVIQKDRNGTPVAYVEGTGFTAESLLSGKAAARVISIDLATRSGEEYRGKGHAVAAGKKMVKWFDRYGYKDYEYMEWAAKEENIASQKTAEKLGFKKLDVHDEGWTLYAYEHKAKHTSIGGTMYIEGNALILGDSSYLEHHGILGQKWGVRRFQNKDGTRTAAGKARDQKNAAKSVVLSTRRTRNSWQYQNAFTKAQDKLTNDSKSAVRKMAIDALNGERKAEYEAAVDEYDAATNYRYDEYLKEDNKYLAIAGMASGQRYPMLDTDKFDQDTRLKWDAEFYMYNDGDQGKYNSYDYFLVAKGENPNKVFDRAMKARNNIESIAKKDADDILGDTKDRVIKGKVKDRTVSDELAYQITEMAISASDYTMVWEHGIPYSDDEIKQMKQDIDKYSKEAARLGLTHSALFIEDGTLYLSHHGIRGQRWGVRRFQNRDGSLTNAGRKRLGYATKGATQAVKKAFNAGVKTGAKAVKAAKAHHEKAEAKKIEKKKEKASKTRAGVYANKDLFTAKELKDLNAKFEEQDKLAMARLKKGVEIAKAVGQYAQTAKQIGDAYQSITGKNILSHITEIKSANEAKAKKEESKAMAKKALQKNIDAFKADQESNARVKDLEKQGNKTAAKTKLAEYIDRYNQDKAAQEQTKQMMKNQKLQEYIDRANQAQREKDSATFKETTDRGKQVIDLLQRHSTDSDLFKEDYQNRVTNAGNSTKPSSVPDDSNLISLVRKANALNSLSTNSTSRSKDSDDLMAKNREAKAAGDIKDASERASKAIGLLGRKDRITNGNSNDNEPTSVSTPSMNDLAKLIRAANSANSKSGPTIEKSQWQRDLEERTRQLKSDDDNRKLANNLDSIKKAASDASKAANSKSNDPSETTQKLLTNNAKKLDNGNREIGGVFEKALMKKEQRAPNLQKLEAAQKKWKSSSDPSLRKKYMKIVSEELQYLSDDEFDLYMAGKLFKHSAFSDPDFIEHYGVRGMKWGKHLMAGKSGGIYDGTALGSGGGGGPMTEEERKKAEELRKKKLEEAKKKAEEAAKEKEIEEKAKEIGISVSAYKRYSIDNNHLPGKRHYDKSLKLHGEASSSLAETQAAERQAHMNRAKAASLMRKVNSSHMFDADGYHISQQRGDDRKEAKQLKKEAKQLDKKSKKALKKFYKKRYKSDREWQKWQNSTSGKYHHMMRHYEIQNGVLFVDSSDSLAHHGVKGQRWGVRRFQNEDGSLTDKGRKHYEKKLAKAERKKVAADAARGYLERTHGFAVTSAAVLSGAAYAALMVASAANPATIALGTAVVAAMYGGAAHLTYSVNEAWEGRGSKKYERQANEYREKLKQSDMEEGMHHVENGTLFVNAGEPYLEHHGVKGMKWGKHLMAGKGVDAEGGGGGGFAEDDEKLKEMAKKAGMSVAEFRTKMAGKLGGAAKEAKKLVVNKSGSSTNAGTRSGYQILPEDLSGAARPKAERKKITRKAVGEALYNIAGGNAKKAAQEHHRNMVNYKNEADKYSRDANIEGSAAKAHKRAGNVSAYVGAKTGARVDEENAKNYRLAQYSEAEEANKAQRKYDRSLAGLYDKATGKYKQVHKQTKTPSLSKQYQYYTKEVNGKLFDHGKPKTAKERAKAEVWNAADYRIKAQDYYNQSFDPTNTVYGYDTAYRKAAVDQGRLAEGAYRRAAALGKQASKETSTSSRPRARKKKHTSGGSGVTVRRPGRKLVSRTKRVTQSSTGVKRRSATGTGARVRRGA